MCHLAASDNVAVSLGRWAGANAVSRFVDQNKCFLHSGGDADNGRILCVSEWGVHGLPL